MSTQDLTSTDVLAIQQLIAEVAYAMDSHEYATQLPVVFTDDVHLENPALDVEGLPRLVELLEGTADPALSHHVSTTTVRATGPDAATCRSKVLTLRSGGRRSAAEFHDTVRRTGTGWKVAERIIRPIPESSGAAASSAAAFDQAVTR